ncbi:hypothetical protein [Pseudomonas protegens]|uniref:hypothetical protein n=1 Tax=Pseudomonas protegens TaxID=380021 RepID=UPI0027550463|nr:hypothetical protein [Pseudomonas protegens]MDP9528551.1 hypothetical protein [Pseudomonas protegens]
MSVKSYTGNYIDENGTVRGDVKVYLSADFDRITAERDALLRDVLHHDECQRAGGGFNLSDLLKRIDLAIGGHA